MKHMKLTFLILAFTLFSSMSLFAQRKVALQHNGVTTIFSGTQPFVDAFNAAVNGDTLYLPGGLLTGPSSYNKGVTIFGTGLRIDSTLVTERTELNSILIGAGADKLNLEGLYVNGSISFSGNTQIDSVTISRCYMENLLISGTTNPCKGVVLKESIVSGTVNGQNTQGISITNNILRYLSNINGGYIANNIIDNTSNSSTRTLSNVAESLIENNYAANSYSSSYFMTSSINNTFMNNAFRHNPTTDLTNTWIGNYINILQTGFFVDFILPFNEIANYNLIDPASFQGTTGNEISIYGGLFPAKEGFVPKNPHFQFKNIGNQTNAAGELQVEITVEAQNE